MATTSDQHAPVPDRPQHRRNRSSKFLRSLVSSKSRPVSPDMTSEPPSSGLQHSIRTQKVPLLPPDHPHQASTRILGERHSNAQSPPSSPSKRNNKASIASRYGSRSPTKPDNSDVKKSKSTTSLSAMFGKMNRSTRDVAAYAPQQQPHGKENTTPPESAVESADTPIWAQFASPGGNDSRPSQEGRPSRDIHEEIDRYTPKDYSPGKQRNFFGSTRTSQPSLRPAAKERPRSTVFAPTDSFMGALGRKVSSARSSMEARRSEDSARRISKEELLRGNPTSNPTSNPTERPALVHRHSERSASGSSNEQPPKEKLNITKRGSRVMAAVAALQGKSKAPSVKEEEALDPKIVDKEFESVLASRNVPEPMRERMRTLTLRVKADFVRQDQGASKPAEADPAHTTPGAGAKEEVEDDSKSTKRSRARSRTFTFSKGDKKGGDSSPSKNARSRSKGRPNSVLVPKGQSAHDALTPTTPTGNSWGRRGHATPAVSEYITYLRKNQDPKKVEVGRLHKLRILLRNETVAWVDDFISQGGMSEVVGLLHRLMGIEWREEHEDQLLHESLLCLKGLCTTERALAELEKVADELFPALIAMVFDDEKKGPAEYTTRTIIVNVLCKSRLSGIASNLLLITSHSHLPCRPDQVDSRRTRKPSTQDFDLPGGAYKGRNRKTRRIRPGHARSSPVQALEPGSLQRYQGSLLDLPTPPERSAFAQRPRPHGPRCRKHGDNQLCCRSPKELDSNIHAAPLPGSSPSRPCSSLHWRRRMGCDNIPSRTPRSAQRPDRLATFRRGTQFAARRIASEWLRENNGLHNAHLQREILLGCARRSPRLGRGRNGGWLGDEIRARGTGYGRASRQSEKLESE
jgi:hypothetical protein